jgi:hypothetical protein
MYAVTHIERFGQGQTRLVGNVMNRTQVENNERRLGKGLEKQINARDMLHVTVDRISPRRLFRHYFVNDSLCARDPLQRCLGRSDRN